MKIDRFVKTMLVVIAVLLALNCATGLRGAADAQSGGAKFGYMHFVAHINGLPGRNPGEQHGMEFVDLRNGNAWGFYIDMTSDRPRGNPVYLGTFDFSALDKLVQK